MLKFLRRLLDRISRRQEMTYNEALEYMEQSTIEMENKRQNYATYMGDALAYYGDDILAEMEQNGESWEDVQETKVRPPARPGANPFYIWTGKFVYFAYLVGDISNVRSIPRDPTENVDSQWQNVPLNPEENTEPSWH